MVDSRIAKFLILCLIGLSTGVSSLSFPKLTSRNASQGVNLASSGVRPAILSDSWPVKRLIANSAGDFAFAGGDFMGGADGLVLIKKDSVVKIAGTGDPVPGRTGLFLTTIGIKGRGISGLDGGFSLNASGQLAFSANVVSCASSSEVVRCAGSSPLLEGIFVFTESGRKTIAMQGDPAPGTGLVFDSFERVLINDNGMIVFVSRLTSAVVVGRVAYGLFSFSQGSIVKMVISNEPTPFGEIAPSQDGISLNDQGVVTFLAYIEGKGYTLFRYENGALSKLVASGDPAPGGRLLSGISEVDANNRGEVVFHSDDALFFRGIDGTISEIIKHRDRTPIGGEFVLFGMCSHAREVRLSPKLNDSGDVLFASPIGGLGSDAGVFLFRDGDVTSVVADGDPVPSEPNLRIRIETFPGNCASEARTKFFLNNMGMAAIATGIAGSEGVSALFTHTKGNLVKLFSPGDAAPGTDGESFVPPGPLVTDRQSGFSLSDSGVVAFHSPLCCGKFKEGVFIAGPSLSSILNGGFEILGDSGLPASWPITWNNSGRGDAFQYNSGGADAFDGDSVLRLHVSAGGGSTFVLSDPIPVSPGAEYSITCQMRYNLESDSDAVYFSIIQFDSAGNDAGFDEVVGVKGDNFWTWVTKALLVRTMPSTASIRIRLGLASKSESYLDVDAVR